jgi:hypothetical protein
MPSSEEKTSSSPDQAGRQIANLFRSRNDVTTRLLQLLEILPITEKYTGKRTNTATVLVNDGRQPLTCRGCRPVSAGVVLFLKPLLGEPRPLTPVQSADDRNATRL